jgi:hypothetical protein
VSRLFRIRLVRQIVLHSSYFAPETAPHCQFVELQSVCDFAPRESRQTKRKYSTTSGTQPPEDFCQICMAVRTFCPTVVKCRPRQGRDVPNQLKPLYFFRITTEQPAKG